MVLEELYYDSDWRTSVEHRTQFCGSIGGISGACATTGGTSSGAYAETGGARCDACAPAKPECSGG